MPRYRVNEPNVVFEAFDEEVVLVNLDSGNYYSVRGSGPAIWIALAAGESPDEIAHRLGATSATAPGEIADQITRFAQNLIEGELLVADDDRMVGARGARSDDGRMVGARGALGAGSALAPTSNGGAFDPPVLEAYADMQDLLMLDPIHDVDPTGWPAARLAAGDG